MKAHHKAVLHDVKRLSLPLIVCISYFLMNPKLTILIDVGLLIFWLSAFIVDMYSTITCMNFIKYEKNIVFVSFVKRFGVKESIPLQLMFELFVAFVIQFLLSDGFDMQLFLEMGSVLGIMHVMAAVSNIKVVKKISRL